MRKIFYFFIIIVAGAAFYFWPVEFGSGLQRIKADITDIFSSLSLQGKDYDQELAAKEAELQAYEGALKQADVQIEQWKQEAESKICPETGRPGVFELKDDPRPSVREHMDRLHQEIAELKRVVKK